MGLLSPTTSATRYKILGELSKPILETVAAGLKKFTISPADDNPTVTSVGWTSLATPFKPDFAGSSFVIGTYLVFSLRIDKKSISPRTIKKHCAEEEAKRMLESGRPFLSRQEKNMIKEHVIHVLSLRIPATPYLYDIVWNYEASSLCFFSTLKSANEAFESLFLKSFEVPVVRLFPYTTADLESGLSDPERDVLQGLSATSFLE